MIWPSAHKRTLHPRQGYIFTSPFSLLHCPPPCIELCCGTTPLYCVASFTTLCIVLHYLVMVVPMVWENSSSCQRYHPVRWWGIWHCGVFRVAGVLVPNTSVCHMWRVLVICGWIGMGLPTSLNCPHQLCWPHLLFFSLSHVCYSPPW